MASRFINYWRVVRFIPSRMAAPRGPPRPPLQWTEDQIDEVLSDSFPASDPPPWTLGTRTFVPNAPRPSPEL